MKKITLFIAIAFCMATSYGQNSLNLQKGKKYLVENKIVTLGNTEVQGQSMESNMDVTTNYNMEVTDVNSANITLKNTITKILMSMAVMGQNINFDSDKTEDLNGPIGSQFKDYINKPLNVKMDKSGEIILDKKREDKSDISPMMLQAFGDMEAQGYGSKLGFQPLPANLKVGNTWSTNIKTSNSNNTTNYTVKSIAGDLATIALDGTVMVDLTMEQQGMEIKTKTKGKLTGTEIVNTKTGVVQSNTTVVISDGTIEVMGQEIPTSSKATSITTIKEI